MPAINVNPTRQELTRLKTRLRTSIRGHKLLKDKRDELMKQFMDVVRENRALRKRVEEGLMRAHGSFTVASALMSTEMLEQALLYPKQSVELDMTFQNIMSVNVPVYHFKTKSDDAGEIYPYGFVHNVEVMMSASDCIVSKPGGLTVSEALAKNLPMLLFDPIPGHEERNVDFLVNNGMAALITKHFPIDEAVYELFRNPVRLETVRRTMSEIAHPDATERLAEFVLRKR